MWKTRRLHRDDELRSEPRVGDSGVSATGLLYSVDTVQQGICQAYQGPRLFGVECRRSEREEIDVWTTSTLWASNWVVLEWDRAVFRMFARVSSVCRGWNAVRVPPRAQCFPCSGACQPLSVHKLFTYGALRGLFWSAVTVAGGSFSWFGQRWRCLLVHGPGCRQLHDWTLAGGAVLPLLVCIS